MASLNESVSKADTPIDHVELSDEETIELINEEKDDSDEKVDNDDDCTKRKSTSTVRVHFTTAEVNEGGKMVTKDHCIHCKKTYKQQKSKTTSQLWRHLKSCPYMKRLKGTKGFINFEKTDSDNASDFILSGGFEPMKCREVIARMIVAHELPFSFVEYHWFNELMKYNNPLYQKVSRGTIRKDCIRVV